MKTWLVAALLLIIGSLAINQAEIRYREDIRAGFHEPQQDYRTLEKQQQQFNNKPRYESEPERRTLLDGLREKVAEVGRATYHHLRGPRPPTYEGEERRTFDMKGSRWQEWSPDADLNVAGGPAHDLSGAVRETAHDVKEAVKDTARGVRDTTVDAGHVVKEDIKDMGHTTAEHGRELKGDLKDIKDAAAAKARHLRGAVYDVKGAFKEEMRNARDAAVETGYRVKDKLTEMKDAAVETGYRLKEAAVDAKDTAEEKVRRWTDNVEEKAVDAGTRVKEEVRTLKHVAEDTGAQVRDATVDKARELKEDAKEAVLNELGDKVQSKYGRFKECLCDAKDQLVYKVNRAKQCVCDVYDRVTGRYEQRNGFERLAEDETNTEASEVVDEVVPQLNLKEEIGHVRETLPLHSDEEVIATHPHAAGALSSDGRVETLKHFDEDKFFVQPTREDFLVTINEAANEPVLRTTGEYVEESILKPETIQELRAALGQQQLPQQGHSRQHPPGVTDLLRGIKNKVAEKYKNYKDRIADKFRRVKSNTADIVRDTADTLSVHTEGEISAVPGDTSRAPMHHEKEPYAYYDTSKFVIESHPHAFELFAVAYKRGADLYEQARKKIGELEEPHATPEMRNELAQEAVILFKDSLQAVEEAEEQMSRRLAHLHRMTKQEYEATRSLGDLAYEGAIARAEEELNHARKLIAILFDQLDQDLPTGAP